MSNSPLPSSFRDPSGFLFRSEGVLYRQIQTGYRGDYETLLGSGLYEELTESDLLIRHEEVGPEAAIESDAFQVIRPEPVPFISYPYEWSFSQLQDAALTTLEIQKRALARGMSLKDATAYNIQFHRGKPTLIDTLSFENYREGEPWVAYRQFCQHFLAPLALMSYCDIRLGQLLRDHIDGIPLDLASGLLPLRSRFRVPLFLHVHQHASHQKKYADKPVSTQNGSKASSQSGSKGGLSKQSLLALIGNLESGVRKLSWRPAGTEWAEYYDATNYSEGSFSEKARLVGEFLKQAAPGSVWDLGANTGHFSRIATGMGIPTQSFDIDPAAVERNYLQCRKEQNPHLLPLVLDLTNPSPGLGWGHEERMSLAERGPADAILALALVHHLAISNNVPLRRIASFLARLGPTLIIEFVPKADSQVKRLLATRPDIFPEYREDGFEAAFSTVYSIVRSEPIPGTERSLYLMRVRDDSSD